MSEAPKTVFVTLYALEDGIFESPMMPYGSDLVLVKHPGGGRCCATKDDWHTTREAAVTRAEQMRDAKLKSLDKQAAKLRAMTFA